MLVLRRVAGPEDRAPGQQALAAVGDVLIGNDRVSAVIDAIGTPHYLAPSGGALLDLAARDENGLSQDEFNHMYQSVGLLTKDAVRYESLELIDRTPELVAVIARGRLDGRPEVDVVTRYEVRPCEPGVRIRSEIFQGSRDREAFFFGDVIFWGGREVTPFIPLPGQGFTPPDLDLVDDFDGSVFRVPFVSAQGHNESTSSYGLLSCDEPTFESFNSIGVSAGGAERRILVPGDSSSLERFIVVARGPGMSGAANEMWDARTQLWGEEMVTLSGTVTRPDGTPLGGDERLIGLLFSDDEKDLNEATPGPDGRFAVRLPRGRRIHIQPHRLGRALPQTVTWQSDADETIADLVIPTPAMMDITLTDGEGNPTFGEVVLTPRAPTTAADVEGSVYGQWASDQCAPFLGQPFGASPSCNRVLIGEDGRVRFAVPPGTYYAYATRGPFAQLARREVTVGDSGETALTFALATLDLVPDGMLAADFHVHGGGSADSSIPEMTRALTFVANGIDVLAATDHDVVTSYAQAIAALGLEDRVHVMPGVETTGHILFLEPPESDSVLPQTIGHFNFWPLAFDPSAPKNGAPDDERMEPGELFDVMAPFFDGPGVIQLNHPYLGTSFARDEGYMSAIGYDPRKAVPAEPANTPEGQLRRRPGGGSTNIDFHVQEVMNGSSTQSFHNFRRLWFSFLNQGILRGGTANSDSHTQQDEVLGYPRTMVLADLDVAALDRSAFNDAVRDGRMMGTNGPLIQICLEAADGTCGGPSLSSPIEPAANGMLRVEVRAAPWIPVTEIRFIVNGRLVETIAEGLAHPDDPFGADGLVRYDGEVRLADLLSDVDSGKDAWIVVEAGLPLWPAADLDDDGLLDTTDIDEDGTVDEADRAAAVDEEHYVEPSMPSPSDPRFHIYIIAPRTYPTAFTNPILVDRNGGGWDAPGLP